jgi:hypothetical protein
VDAGLERQAGALDYFFEDDAGGGVDALEIEAGAEVLAHEIAGVALGAADHEREDSVRHLVTGGARGFLPGDPRDALGVDHEAVHVEDNAGIGGHKVHNLHRIGRDASPLASERQGTAVPTFQNAASRVLWVMPWQVEMRGGSIFLPQVDLWCDARKPVDFSFVSHAHFDHLALHPRIITSEGTRRLMAARLPGEREEIVLPFGEPYALRPDTELTLHPAGHIFGSAMLRLVREGESFLYTGDFKLRPGRSAEKCEPPRADVVVMETTFGLPRYIFPPTEEVLANLIGFCRQAIEDGEVPVIFGYSLGKSQELLSSLAAAELPVMLHPQTLKMTRIYEELGQEFPAYRQVHADGIGGACGGVSAAVEQLGVAAQDQAAAHGGDHRLGDGSGRGLPLPMRRGVSAERSRGLRGPAALRRAGAAEACLHRARLHVRSSRGRCASVESRRGRWGRIISWRYRSRS